VGLYSASLEESVAKVLITLEARRKMRDMQNHSTTTPTIFSVVTQHLDPVANGVGDLDKRVTVAAEFDTWTEAVEYAESTNFEIDGSMFPNIDLDEIGDQFGEYQSGFWHRDNKYAAIFLVGPYAE
jgi:hypothetical protein